MTAPEATGRVMGLDLGSRRIGVAVSDDGRRVASALTVVARSSRHEQDHVALASLVTGTGANLVIVGLPLSLSGISGPAASAVKTEVMELRRALDVPVHWCDERYTTVIAQRALASGGRRPRARRSVVDQVAAAAILQTWLDRQRAAAALAVGPDAAMGPGGGTATGTVGSGCPAGR